MPEQTKTGFDGSPEVRPVELLARSSPRRNASSCSASSALSWADERQPELDDAIASRSPRSRCRGAPRAAGRARREAHSDRTAPDRTAQPRCAPRAAASRRGRRRAFRRAARGDLGVGRRLQDGVSVRAAEAEGIDAARGGCPWVSGQGSSSLRNPQPQIVERDLRVRILEMQVRGNLAVLQTQRRLDQAGDPRAPPPDDPYCS